jgi:hypothetical protein
VYDYVGYGQNTEKASTERGVFEDVEAVYQHITQTQGIPPEKVIL